MSTNNQITNSDNVIDSRDVIARIEELEGIAESVALDEEEHEELVALKELAEQGEGFEDWKYGVALVRDSYFKAYAMELAEAIGAIGSSASWPSTCIDWDQAAWELRMDCSSVKFDGVTYWAR